MLHGKVPFRVCINAAAAAAGARSVTWRPLPFQQHDICISAYVFASSAVTRYIKWSNRWTVSSEMGSLQQQPVADAELPQQQLKSTAISSKYDLKVLFRLSIVNITLFPISAALEVQIFQYVYLFIKLIWIIQGLWTIYGHGIWCGLFYLVTGYLGFIVSCKRPCRPTKPLSVFLIQYTRQNLIDLFNQIRFIATVVFASLSIIFSIVAFALSVISCIAHCHRECKLTLIYNLNCNVINYFILLDIYNSSSIGLAAVSLIAFIINLTTIGFVIVRGIPSSDAIDKDEIINGIKLLCT